MSFVLLRQEPAEHRSALREPVGRRRRATSPASIAVVALVSIFLNEDYRPGVYGVAVYFVLGILYFAIVGRHRLVLSPEEEFALTQGEQGVPEAGRVLVIGGRAGGDPARR